MFTIHPLWINIYVCMHVFHVHIPVGVYTHTCGYKIHMYSHVWRTEVSVRCPSQSLSSSLFLR